MNILSPVTAVLAIMNQAFQSWRIWVFIKNKYIVGGLLLTALVVFITGVIAGAQSWILSECAFPYSLLRYIFLSLPQRSLPTHIHAHILSTAYENWPHSSRSWRETWRCRPRSMSSSPVSQILCC
jgi:hypothetical protein